MNYMYIYTFGDTNNAEFIIKCHIPFLYAHKGAYHMPLTFHYSIINKYVGIF